MVLKKSVTQINNNKSVFTCEYTLDFQKQGKVDTLDDTFFHSMKKNVVRSYTFL